MWCLYFQQIKRSLPQFQINILDFLYSWKLVLFNSTSGPCKIFPFWLQIPKTIYLFLIFTRIVAMILVFSPFNIVRFRNDECLGEGAASGESGICYTQEECSSRGGRASGNCAAGFGKCCVCKNSFAKCATYALSFYGPKMILDCPNHLFWSGSNHFGQF